MYDISAGVQVAGGKASSSGSRRLWCTRRVKPMFALPLPPWRHARMGHMRRISRFQRRPSRVGIFPVAGDAFATALFMHLKTR